MSFEGFYRNIVPARQSASNIFQTCCRLYPGSGGLQYDGAIPKPHPRDDSLYAGISRPASLDKRYLLGVSSF